MSDLISRQAAIDALDVLCQEHRYKIPGKAETYSQYNEAWQDALDRAEGAIFNLPPAKPELCEDTVSRQRLLSDLKELVVAWEKYPVMAEQIKGVETAIGYVETIPPAQPEKRAETHGVCLDAISRQDVIEVIQNRPMMLSKEKVLLINDIKKLPSAQPEPIRINLNEPIMVKLTDWGKEIYYHQYDRANQIAGRGICKPKFPKEDENGYTEFQLWRFMELYGEHMGMTMPNVIEPLEIVYERRTG